MNRLSKTKMMDFNKILKNSKINSPQLYHLIKNSKEVNDLVNPNIQQRPMISSCYTIAKSQTLSSFNKLSEIKNIFDNGAQFHRNLHYANYYPNEQFPKTYLNEQQISEIFEDSVLLKENKFEKLAPTSSSIILSSRYLFPINTNHFN